MRGASWSVMCSWWQPSGATHCAYVEYGKASERPEKEEPTHYHLDIEYAFVTARADVGRIEELQVPGTSRYLLAVAERLSQVPRSVGGQHAGPDRLTGPRGTRLAPPRAGRQGRPACLVSQLTSI